MPSRTRTSRDYGFRTSVLIPEEIEKLIQRSRAAYKKTHGYAPSRSAMIIIAVRGFFKQPDWLEKGIGNGWNGQ